MTSSPDGRADGHARRIPQYGRRHRRPADGPAVVRRYRDAVGGADAHADGADAHADGGADVGVFAGGL